MIFLYGILTLYHGIYIMSNCKATENFKGRGGGGGGRLFGGVGIGAGVVCDSKDDSVYCNFIKFMTVIIYLMVLYFILSFVYNFFVTTKLGRRLFGGR